MKLWVFGASRRTGSMAEQESAPPMTKSAHVTSKPGQSRTGAIATRTNERNEALVDETDKWHRSAFRVPRRSTVENFMAAIPSSINGVAIDFAPGVNNDAIPMLIDGLLHTISPTVGPGHTLSRIWISSVRDSHVCPSRHVTGNACDLSRINGKKIGEHYVSDPMVRTIVDALQHRFESYLPHRRENYGPTIKLKLGQPDNPGGHDDHVHLSVSGAHNCPAPGLLDRLLRLFRRIRKQSEICNFAQE